MHKTVVEPCDLMDDGKYTEEDIQLVVQGTIPRMRLLDAPVAAITIHKNLHCDTQMLCDNSTAARDYVVSKCVSEACKSALLEAQRLYGTSSIFYLTHFIDKVKVTIYGTPVVQTHLAVVFGVHVGHLTQRVVRGGRYA